MFIRLVVNNGFQQLMLITVDVALGPHVLCNQVCRVFSLHTVLEFDRMWKRRAI